ncbi:DUF4192 domain-containing protein [Kineococcus rhizosphaerae]|uniref:Uncharacterized protein DUF4192 n=1 Tax=Kineococcus rhizosphaerae TaxID=559628 RepID=A0A2T0RBA0_9ACTN|nr:DUF4192 domain-containing protein [Kineococcus rhizosphaerae]PRY18448.1 uncharacterized protein DUF4192 [Kineococcus rhizosphaerae]
MSTAPVHPPPDSEPEPDRIVARGPGELLALVPYLFGFHPGDSVVLLEVRAPGPDGRRLLGFAARVDLPPSAEPHLVTAATGPLVRTAHRRTGAGAQVHLLVHDPDAHEVDGALVPGARARATVAHLRQALRRLPTGAELGDVLLVGEDRWRSLTCERPCCPPAGAPRSGAGAGRVVAEAVWRGLTTAPDRAASLPGTSPVDPARREAATRGRRRVPSDPVALVAAFDAAVRERPLTGVPALPDPTWCGRVLEGLRDTAVRDAVLLAGGAGAATDRARAALLTGGGEPPPDGERVGDLLERALGEDFELPRALAAAGLAVDVARHATGPLAAPAWTVAGWLEWRSGRGARAAVCVEQALRHDPGHRLAVLVDRALRLGLAPHR